MTVKVFFGHEASRQVERQLHLPVAGVRVEHKKTKPEVTEEPRNEIFPELLEEGVKQKFAPGQAGPAKVVVPWNDQQRAAGMNVSCRTKLLD